jgi:hypothetical protein
MRTKYCKIIDGIGSGCTASIITAIAAIGLASGVGIWNNLSGDNLEIDKRVTGVLQTAGVIISMGSVGAFASGFLISRLADWERLVSENQQLKQCLAEEEKSHEENCQEWRKDFSEQNRTWEEHVYKLCREIERLKIADSEKDYKIKQLKQQLAAYQQQLEVNLSNNFDELN